MTYLRYAPDIEKPAADAQATIEGIIKGMTQQSEVVEAREHQAVRASHAKSSACVTGELTIAAGLQPELAQGLFATPGTHPAAVRFAQGPGETLGDRVSTHRGMSIKVFDVPGEKLRCPATPSIPRTSSSRQAPPFPRGRRLASFEMAPVRRQHLWDRMRVFTNGGWLVHRSP